MMRRPHADRGKNRDPGSDGTQSVDSSLPIKERSTIYLTVIFDCQSREMLCLPNIRLTNTKTRYS